MPASEAQRARLRLMLGDSNPDALLFTNDELDDLWDWAAEDYSDDASILVQAQILGFDTILADAAKRVNYKQNQSSEDLSDVFKHLMELRKLAQGKLDGLIAATRTGVRLGSMRKVKPTRSRDIPSS